MSYKTDTENSINWIEKTISKKRIKYYEYEYFNDIQEIDSEGFGKTFRVKWKKSNQYLSLKSFKKFDNLVVKELVHELKLRLRVEFYNNIIGFYGITTKENEIDKTKEYLLVTEYADSGNLRNYLKNNFHRLTWDNKYELAYQLAGAVSYLHEEEMVHLDLHSKSILVHQNIIKLADFGLTRRIEEASKNQTRPFSIPYTDPKRLTNRKYNLNQKSDVYSIGVLLWEISSGRPPFYNDGKAYDIGLIYEISQGNREKPIPGTPDSYVKIYTECWNQEPDNRPTIDEVVDKLKSAKNAKNENNVKNAKNAKNDQTNKLGRDPNADRSNYSSNDINRIVTNRVVDCIKFKNEIVKPIGTMVNGIINDIVNKNQEREFDDVIDRDIFNDRNKNNNVKSQQTYDHLLINQQDSGSNNLSERLRAEREKVVKMCKEAENVFAEVGDAIEKQDRKKILGMIKKSAEGAVAEILQSNSQNDEEMVEIIESLQKTAQRTAEAVHESPCNVN
ncbi:unnamed protein product [Rhizophagus irregularis]|nr:unnamed protein product [Rhizophagus irregularis]